MSEKDHQSLIDTLLRLRKRIRQTRNREQNIGEQNTKATLVEPLLSALGWDVEELDEVVREYKRKPQDKPVDYALFVQRSPRLFVEAKALGEDLTNRKWMSQTLGYATVAGVEWCVLTNGDEYRLFNAHAAVDVEEKLYRCVRISNPTQEEYAADTLELLSKEKMTENLLSVLWKSHFVDRKVKGALDELVRHGDASLIRLIGKKTTGLNRSEIRASLKRASVSIDFPMISVGTGLAEKGSTAKGIEAALREQATTKVGKRRVSEARREAGKKAWATICSRSDATVINLIRAGLIQPPLDLETDYKEVHLKAVIQGDGSVVFNGESYNSLTTAGGRARRSVLGGPRTRPPPPTNGWTFWKYRDLGTGKLLAMSVLRQRYLERNR